MYKKYNFKPKFPFLLSTQNNQKENNCKINYLEIFRSWLKSKNYNPNTVRNYIVDLKKYLIFSNNENIFLESVISSYTSQISKENNCARQLASLNKFCQFAIDQKMISFNPIKKHQFQTDTKTPSNDLNSILKQYQNFLLKKNFTQNSIKNYINDINQYISWIQLEKT